MKISIAVPSYNYGQFIKTCLESIYIQNHSDYEVLIADGGSSDDSIEIIKSFCLLDERFKFVSTSDEGQSDAIMKAFAHATGDIFCFLNADDCFICKDALTSVERAFNNYPDVSIVNFNGYYINSIGHYLKPVRLRYHPFDNVGLMKYRSAVLQPATFWKRVVQEQTPMLVNSHYVFDALFFYQAYSNFSWIELSKPIAGHRLHGKNKSLQINFKRVNELAKFEGVKFGTNSFRSIYLHIISYIVFVFDKIPVFGWLLNRVIYIIINSISFLTYYRFPSI